MAKTRDGEENILKTAGKEKLRTQEYRKKIQTSFQKTIQVRSQKNNMFIVLNTKVCKQILYSEKI